MESSQQRTQNGPNSPNTQSGRNVQDLNQTKSQHTQQDLHEMAREVQRVHRDQITVLELETKDGINKKIVLHSFPSMAEVAALLQRENAHLEGASFVSRTTYTGGQNGLRGGSIREFIVVDNARTQALNQRSSPLGREVNNLGSPLLSSGTLPRQGPVSPRRSIATQPQNGRSNIPFSRISVGEQFGRSNIPPSSQASIGGQFGRSNIPPSRAYIPPRGSPNTLGSPFAQIPTNERPLSPRRSPFAPSVDEFYNEENDIVEW